MSRVYVVQQPMMRDRSTSELVPKFDLSDAKVFGELVFLLGDRARPWRPNDEGHLQVSAGILDEIEDRLADFGDDDFLLLTGNPILIGIAAHLAWEINGGRVWFLQWHGRDRRYMVVHLDGEAE